MPLLFDDTFTRAVNQDEEGEMDEEEPPLEDEEENLEPDEDDDNPEAVMQIM